MSGARWALRPLASASFSLGAAPHAHRSARRPRAPGARERRVRAHARRRVRGATRDTALPTRLLVFFGPGDDSTPRARAQARASPPAAPRSVG